jgi:hypothetical protein
MNITLRDLPTELRKGKVRFEAALHGFSDLGKAAAFVHRSQHLGTPQADGRICGIANTRRNALREIPGKSCGLQTIS